MITVSPMFSDHMVLQRNKLISVFGSGESGEEVTVAVARDNVFATQFHPEKSGEWGLKILDNFLKV